MAIHVIVATFISNWLGTSILAFNELFSRFPRNPNFTKGQVLHDTIAVNFLSIYIILVQVFISKLTCNLQFDHFPSNHLIWCLNVPMTGIHSVFFNADQLVLDLKIHLLNQCSSIKGEIYTTKIKIPLQESLGLKIKYVPLFRVNCNSETKAKKKKTDFNMLKFFSTL